MPNRILKESICESEGLSKCSIFAQDLYKRLITYADDYGRFNADTMIMLARLYPRELESVTEEDIIDALCELVGEHKIEFYTAQPRHKVYGCFPRWAEHQRIRDSKTKCPDPDDTTVNDWYLQRFVSMDMKVAIIERDGFKCQICNKYITSDRNAYRLAKHGNGMYHIDHIVPVLQGGRATMENLRLCCPQCNQHRKKRFTFSEIAAFAASCGESPRVAASCGELPPNPIQSNPYPIQSVSESESISNARARAGSTSTAQEQAFDKFWEIYPKKRSKGQAMKAWEKLNPSSETIDAIMEKLPELMQTRDWTKDGGQFIPYPATWLNARGWEDEIMPVEQEESSNIFLQLLKEGAFDDDQTGRS